MKNVLIVDDEETVRVTLSEWFSATYGSREYKVFLASNGIEAIKILAANPVDLLITDLNMPKMDGFELLAQMKSDHPRIPIIVISAFSTPDIKTKVVDLGALRFIPKPFSFSDLEGIDFPKLLEPSTKPGAGKGFVNGISLQSFLQLISMEAKSCTLTVRSGGKTGEIFLERGELMDARTGNLEGEEASYEIISWSDEGLTIEIDNVCRTKERKIEFPIMHLLMESARMADERAINEAGIIDEDQTQEIEKTLILKAGQVQADIEKEKASPLPVQKPQPPPPKPTPSPAPPQTATRSLPQTPGETPEHGQINLSRLNLVKIQERCKEFAALDGFAGAVLLTDNGDILQVVSTDGTNINLERASIYANNILSTVQIHSKNMGLGVTSLVQVDTKGGHLLIAGRAKINLMLVLVTSSSLGLAKIMVNSAITEICAEIGC